MSKFKLTQLRRNILSGSVVQGLNISIIFFSYPLYIHFLGFEQFSVWVLLSVIISFAQFGDFGIGKAIINHVAAVNREEDKKKNLNIQKILLNGLAVVIFISIIIQLIINIFTNDIIQLLNVPPKYVLQATFVVPLIGISIFLFLVYDCIASVLTGMGRLDIYNALLLFLNIIKISLTITLLVYKPQISSMVYGVLFSNILLIGIIVIILLRNKISFRFRLHTVSLKIIKQLLTFGIPLLGIQTVNVIMFPFIKIVISRFFGIEFVGFFELATKAAYSFRTLFEKGLFALLPEFSKHSETYFTDNMSREKLREGVLRMTKIVAKFGIPTLVLVSLFSGFLLKLWLNKSFTPSIHTGFLLLQPGIIVGLVSLPAYYALMAMRKQVYCFMESIIRLLITFVMFSLFFIIKLDFVYVFIFVSTAVVASNVFVLFSFRYKV